MQSRVILFHKTATSGRTCFLKFDHGGVCGPEPIPGIAQVMQPPADNAIALHPAQLVQTTSQALGIEQGELEVESEFHQWVDVARGPVQVFLVRFKSIDPPFQLAEQLGGSFVELAGARSLPPVELELLRTAYECVMEG